MMTGVGTVRSDLCHSRGGDSHQNRTPKWERLSEGTSGSIGASLLQ